MRKRVVIENRLGEKVEFGPFPPYVLVSIDLSGSEADIVRTQGYMQDGVTTGAVTMREMQYPLEFYIEGESLADVYGYRRHLNRILNPKLKPFTLTITLPHGTFQNKITIESLPKYRVEDEQYKILQQGLLHINTPDPYWKNEKDREIPLISWKPTFRFPFSFDPTVKFGVKGEQKFVTNDGDVETPLHITIYGPCTTQVITNLTTMQSIKVEREVPAGWRLEIDTTYGHNTVELIKSDGTRINAYNWIAPGVRLNEFRLQIGLNILDYSANAGRESATVIIRFRERYIGI